MSKFAVFGATAWLTACLFPAPATAQSRLDTDPLDRDIVAVGAGLAVVPDYEGSDHYRLASRPPRSDRSRDTASSSPATRPASIC